MKFRTLLEFLKPLGSWVMRRLAGASPRTTEEVEEEMRQRVSGNRDDIADSIEEKFQD